MEWFMVSPLIMAKLFFVATMAGFIDALAGGGGLLTVPALMAAGMSPALSAARWSISVRKNSIFS